MQRRIWLLAGALGTSGLLRPVWAAPGFTRLAAVDPPYEERYEVLVAMAPPLARGMIGKALGRIVTEADENWKSDRLTALLDPQRTRLHEYFVRELAAGLAAAGVRVVLVPVGPVRDEATLLREVRDLSRSADAVMLANVQARFVAVTGLAAYQPWVMIGVRVVSPDGARVLLERIYSAGFLGIDPRAENVDVDLPQRFDNFDALMAQPDAARQALEQAVEAIAERAAQTLLG